MPLNLNWRPLALLPLIMLAGCETVSKPKPLEVVASQRVTAAMPTPPVQLTAPVECPSWMKKTCGSVPKTQ